MRALEFLAPAAVGRGWLWLTLGGALLMPYMILGGLLYGWNDATAQAAGGIFHPGVFLATLPFIVLTAPFLPVGPVERSAARTLLRLDLPDPPRAESWNTRWRAGLGFAFHVAVGGIVAGMSLATVPFSLYLALHGAGFVEDLGLVEPAWLTRYGLLTGPAMLVTLWIVTAAVAAAAKPVERRLLGPGDRDRRLLAEEENARLAARNRIATELHDSVGHALSAVAVQAEAASLLVEEDPEFTRRALAAMRDKATGALKELDAAIGVLRNGERDAPAADVGLSGLDDLIASSGVAVDLEASGDLDAVPRAVSREAYRILQESLTNVLRHADRAEAAVRIDAEADRLGLAVESPCSNRTAPRAGGAGIIGIGERAALLGGSADAGRDGGQWVVTAELPWERP
ncbi:sensor histidine kinase [Salininema proteolyticum]|uniref:histidine kinase n=1 Tax=Salininema proteolyticum TaxID=1607685 RepID=A0ABV8U471_9ACTN